MHTYKHGRARRGAHRYQHGDRVGITIIDLRTDSATVYKWIDDALSGRSRLRTKAHGEMLIRRRINVIRQPVEEATAVRAVEEATTVSTMQEAIAVRAVEEATAVRAVAALDVQFCTYAGAECGLCECLKICGTVVGAIGVGFSYRVCRF